MIWKSCGVSSVTFFLEAINHEVLPMFKGLNTYLPDKDDKTLEGHGGLEIILWLIRK